MLKTIKEFVRLIQSQRYQLYVSLLLVSVTVYYL